MTTERADNVIGFDSNDVTYIRFINIGEGTLNNISGSLYNESGNVIGNEDTVLVDSLVSKSQVWRSRDRISDLIEATWNGTASLKIDSPPADLRLLNLNLVNNETFFNFSCFEMAE